MHEGFAIAAVGVLVAGVSEVGVLFVVEIIDADVDGAVPVFAFELAVEVYADVGAVVVGHAEVVA